MGSRVSAEEKHNISGEAEMASRGVKLYLQGKHHVPVQCDFCPQRWENCWAKEPPLHLLAFLLGHIGPKISLDGEIKMSLFWPHSLLCLTFRILLALFIIGLGTKSPKTRIDATLDRVTLPISTLEPCKSAKVGTLQSTRRRISMHLAAPTKHAQAMKIVVACCYVLLLATNLGAFHTCPTLPLYSKKSRATRFYCHQVMEKSAISKAHKISGTF